MERNNFKALTLISVILVIFILFFKWWLSGLEKPPGSEVYILKVKRVDQNKKFTIPAGQSSLTPDNQVVMYIAQAIGSSVNNESNIKIVYDQSSGYLNYNIGLKYDELYEEIFNKLSKAELYLVPLDYHYPKRRYANDGFLEIRLYPANPTLRPFLLNPSNVNAKSRYCVQNSDCLLYQDAFKAITVGNKYIMFGSMGYDEQTQITYDQNHQINNSEPPYEVCNLIYSDPECVNNYCTGEKSWGSCWKPGYY